MKGILLHAGHGTRLRPLTHTGPKQLLPIANKPMSQYCIESMKEAGVTEIAVIIGGVGSNKVREYYGNGEKFGVKIIYVEQDSPRGIAHAIGLCNDFIGNEKFLVFLGDNIIHKNIHDFANEFVISDDDASILLCEVENPSRFGIADMKNGKITQIMEKPKDPPTNYAVTGIYFLTPKIFEIIENLKPSWRNELEITDALQILLSKNNKISYHIITDYWKDTGTPEDIIDANKTILENKKSYFYGEKSKDSTLIGSVFVGKDTKILGKSQITGPVILGENCILENVCIGPNSSIGDNSKIIHSDIENSIVMSDCIINSPIKIRNSIISSNSQIQMKNDSQDEKIFLLGEGTRIFI
ncbi:MAG: glucose-1-phosphate thymidylyltransferase [Candidatus Nitrosopumilus sp. bin_68KS]